MTTSPISAAICVKKEEKELFQTITESSFFPSRVRVAMFVPERTNFPINKLRNLAYTNSDSTHVLVIDIDVIPSRPLSAPLSRLASLHSTFLSLPNDVLDDPHLALVLPLFEMAHYTMNCPHWFDCHSESSPFFPFTLE